MGGAVIGGIGTVAVLAAIAGFVCWRKNKFPKVQPWLFLLAGTGLATGAGVLGGVVTKVANVGTGAMSSVMGAVLGGAAAGALWFWMTLALAFHMHPKGLPPTKWTRWVALVYPTVTIVTFGVAAASVLKMLDGAVGTGGNLIADIWQAFMRQV